MDKLECKTCRKHIPEKGMQKHTQRCEKSSKAVSNTPFKPKTWEERREEERELKREERRAVFKNLVYVEELQQKPIPYWMMMTVKKDYWKSSEFSQLQCHTLDYANIFLDAMSLSTKGDLYYLRKHASLFEDIVGDIIISEDECLLRALRSCRNFKYAFLQKSEKVEVLFKRNLVDDMFKFVWKGENAFLLAHYNEKMTRVEAHVYMKSNAEISQFKQSVERLCEKAETPKEEVFKRVPVPITSGIFREYFTAEELLGLACVCKQFKRAIFHSYCWSFVEMSTFVATQIIGIAKLAGEDLLSVVLSRCNFLTSEQMQALHVCRGLRKVVANECFEIDKELCELFKRLECLEEVEMVGMNCSSSTMRLLLSHGSLERLRVQTMKNVEEFLPKKPHLKMKELDFSLCSSLKNAGAFLSELNNKYPNLETLSVDLHNDNSSNYTSSFTEFRHLKELRVRVKHLSNLVGFRVHSSLSELSVFLTENFTYENPKKSSLSKFNKQPCKLKRIKKSQIGELSLNDFLQIELDSFNSPLANVETFKLSHQLFSIEGSSLQRFILQVPCYHISSFYFSQTFLVIETAQNEEVIVKVFN